MTLRAESLMSWFLLNPGDMGSGKLKVPLLLEFTEPLSDGVDINSGEIGWVAETGLIMGAFGRFL